MTRRLGLILLGWKFRRGVGCGDGAALAMALRRRAVRRVRGRQRGRDKRWARRHGCEPRLPPRARRSGQEHADAPNSLGLLRAHCERPRRRRAAEERDELAASHAGHGGADAGNGNEAQSRKEVQGAPTGSLRRQPRSGSLGAIISPVQVAIRITSLRKIRGIYAGEVEQS